MVSLITAPLKSGTSVSQSFTYDSLGRRKTVQTLNPDLGNRNYSYNDAGQIYQQTFYEHGATIPKNLTSYSYDDFGQLTSANKNIINVGPATADESFQFSYQYDSIGNRTDEQRNGFNFGFQHNSVNQMGHRDWSGTLVASGKTDPGASTIGINAHSGSLDTDGKYVVQPLAVK